MVERDVRSAIKFFANDKSPGCDGLTAEFYQKCFGLIGSDLVDVPQCYSDM